jgi:hypothetical protein
MGRGLRALKTEVALQSPEWGAGFPMKLDEWRPVKRGRSSAAGLPPGSLTFRGGLFKGNNKKTPGSLPRGLTRLWLASVRPEATYIP